MQREIHLSLDANTPEATVHPEVYGHFAEHLGRCIYEGIWVGEDSEIPNTRGIRNDVVEALRHLDIPAIRWPGGCFADEYHWRDGIGPREKRPARINTHWGGVIENNHFGTHEFFDLVEQLGTKAYVCGNVGSGSVQEMMEWVEYMTCPADSSLARLRHKNGRQDPWPLDYFGVGNESWVCGGNMRPEYYADLFRRYNTFVKDYTETPIYRIACGANDDDTRWTEVLMERAGNYMDGLSLHYYTRPTGDWHSKGPATGFSEKDYYETLKQAAQMKRRLAEHVAIMDQHDPEQRVGLVVDEWGVWTDVEPGTHPRFLYQQNTLRDALVAGLHFHYFHEHAGRMRMANIAQTVNVLQAMILTDGPRMLRTPSYWIFEMFKPHQGGQVLPLHGHIDSTGSGDEQTLFSASATRAADQTIWLSMLNLHCTRGQSVHTELNLPQAQVVQARILTAPAVDAHNTFSTPDAVFPTPFEGVTVAGNRLSIELPPRSAVVLGLR